MEYEEWSNWLISAVYGAEYLDAVVQCAIKINEVIDGGCLDGQFRDATDRFMCDTVPRLLWSIIHLESQTDECINAYVEFIQNALRLAIWEVRNDKVQCFGAFMLILDLTKPLYCMRVMEDGQNVSCYSSIVDFVVENCYLELILARIEDAEKAALFEHFNVLYDVMNAVFGAFGSDVIMRALVRSVDALGICLDRCMDEKIAKQQLNVISCVFHRLLGTIARFGPDIDLVTDGAIFRFLGFCVRSSIFNLQIFGVQMMSRYALCDCIMSKKRLSEMIIDKHMLEHLVERDFKEQILRDALPVFSLHCRNDVLEDSLSLFDMIWAVAHERSGDDKKVMCHVAAVCVSSMAREKAASCLHRAFEDANALDNIVFFRMSLWLMTDSAQAESWISVMKFLFANIENANVRWVLNQSVCERPVPSSVADAAAEIVADLVAGDEKWDVIPQLQSAIVVCSSDDTIAEVIKAVGKSPLFCSSLLISMAGKHGHVYCQCEIQMIMKAIGEIRNSCAFLANLMTVNGKNAMDETALDLVRNMLEMVAPEAVNNAVAACLTKYFVLMNYKAGFASMPEGTTGLNASWSWTTHDLLLIDMLYDMCLVVIDEMVSKFLMEYIVWVYSSLTVNFSREVVTKEFWNVIERRIATDHVESRAICKLLTITMMFIKKVEITVVVEDWGCAIHYSSKPLNVNVSGPGVTHTFHLPENANVGNLRQQICEYWSVISAQFKLALGDKVLDDDKALSEHGVIDGSYIAFSFYDSVPETDRVTTLTNSYTPLVVRLTNMKLQERLAGWCLDNPDIGGCAWKLLKVLPYAKEMDITVDNVMERLSTVSTKWALKFALSRLDARDQGEFIAEFCDKGGMAALVERFSSDQDNYAFLARKLSIVGCMWCQPFIPLIVRRTLQLIIIHRSEKSLLSLLYRCAEADKTMFYESLESDMNIMESVITMEYNDTRLCALLCEISNSVPVLNILAKRLDLNRLCSGPPSLEFDVFVSLAQKSGVALDTRDITEKCKAMLDEADSVKMTRLVKIMAALKCGDNLTVVRLCERAFECGNAQLLNEVLEYSRVMNVDIDAVVQRYMQIATQPSKERYCSKSKADGGYVGLRNLGATCYMNSVLQQLFAIRHFTFLVLSNSFDDEAGKEIQKLFASLLLSSKRSIDTAPMCAVWKGWQNEIIDRLEQQDANEFFQLFVDQMPEEAKSVFQGCLVNTIEGISESFKSTNSEHFLCLTMTVKGFSSLEESIQEFLKSEMFIGDNQISAEELGRKIDARKFTRISKAPPVLAVQLKRFEYDFSTWRRYKINDYFSFPLELDMKSMMVDDTSEVVYDLCGMVLHSGTADGGHYTSVVKNGDLWFLCDDSDVQPWSLNCMTADGFGTSGVNAYILFYSRRGATFDIGNQLISYSDPGFAPLLPRIQSDIAQALKEENRDLSIYQSVHGRGLSAFIKESDNLSLVVRYFFSVYWRSANHDVGEMAGIMKAKIIGQHWENDFIRFLCDNAKLFIDGLFIERWCDIIVVIVCEVIVGAESSVVLDLLDCFARRVDSFADTWWHNASLMCIPVRCIESRPDITVIAAERGWHTICFDVIQKFYIASRDICDLETVNFSNMFIIMYHCFDHITDTSCYSGLQRFVDSILIADAQGSAFVRLALKCPSLITINLEIVLEKHWLSEDQRSELVSLMTS